MVTKDIGTLRSKDSEGEKNSSLKQQLNSLLYLRKVIDHRIHRLQGEDSDSFGVPSQVWRCHLGYDVAISGMTMTLPSQVWRWDLHGKSWKLIKFKLHRVSEYPTSLVFRSRTCNPFSSVPDFVCLCFYVHWSEKWSSFLDTFLQLLVYCDPKNGL